MSILLDLSDVIIEEGQIATIVITVTDGATGNVTIKIGNLTKTIGLANGRAQLLVPGLDVKEYDVNVKDGKFDTVRAGTYYIRYFAVDKYGKENKEELFLFFA